MPYIVTTKRLCIDVEDGVERDRSEALSRRAVATLEEARVLAHNTVAAVDAEAGVAYFFYQQARVLSESGGTVGPLPDGTVIEVELVFWHRLRQEALGFFTEGTPAEILTAFNAKQAA